MVNGRGGGAGAAADPRDRGHRVRGSRWPARSRSGGYCYAQSGGRSGARRDGEGGPDRAVRGKHDRRIDMDRDRVTVAGKPVRVAQLVHLMLNKPRGVVTTAADEQGRSTVYTVLGDAELPWVGPVGRLDKASEGLLLLTNDTRWAATLLAPESHVDKCYHVQIDRVPDAQLCARLVRGTARGSSSTDPGVDEVTDDVGRAKAARVLRAGEHRVAGNNFLNKGPGKFTTCSARATFRFCAWCGSRARAQRARARAARGRGRARGYRQAGHRRDVAKGAWRHLTAAEVAALSSWSLATAAGATTWRPGGLAGIASTGTCDAVRAEIAVEPDLSRSQPCGCVVTTTIGENHQACSS